MPRIDQKQNRMFYTAAISDEDVLLCFSSTDEILSRRQIAERLWRAVTPGLIDRLERLVTEGKLHRREDTLRNGLTMFWYNKTKKGAVNHGRN
jgi:hypothetical protein